MENIVEFEEGWNSMKEIITKLKRIFEGHTQEHVTSYEYIMSYTEVYNMAAYSRNGYTQQALYDKYKKIFDDYINLTVIPSLRRLNNESLLRDLVRRWNNHKVMVRLLSHFFFYIDRVFVTGRNVPSLRDVGWACFRDQAFKEFKYQAADGIIALIEKEREGEKIERDLLKNVIDLYVEIEESEDSYVNNIEDSLLKKTSEYYSRKASHWLAQDSCVDYMFKVEECLNKEKERVSHYLQPRTETKLLENVKNQLLASRTIELLKKDSWCLELLRDNKVEDLSRICRIIRRIPQGMERVAKLFKQHVISEGMALVKQTEDETSNKVLEKKVIELHNKYSGYVDDCFANDPLLHKSIKEAFEAFWNTPIGGVQTAEFLASYCDDILKRDGVEKLSDEAIEETFDNVIRLLAYITDKDLFAEFCRKKLSRRLLFEKSANEEHEKLFLSKLKRYIGGHLTSKMEGMITDIAQKDENQKKFKNFFNEIHTLDVDLNVTVLKTSVWPTYKSYDLNLPTEMAKCVEIYNDFYKCITNRRKLNWIYSLGNCNINGKFKKNTIELIVTTFQAAVLLLFNNADKLSYTDIKNQLNMDDDDDLIRSLHSLSCAKYKILNKEPNTRSVSTNDYFEFNSDFTDRLRRIRIPLPPIDERKKVVQFVEKDRRYNIDAAVMRIMKSRKVLDQRQLNVECVKQLSPMFKPDLKEIKKRVEDLIAREYIERDQDSPNVFKYIA